MLPEEAANEAIQHLRGSCAPLWEDYSEWEDEVFLGIVDEAIFNCSQCGWWCDTSDLSRNEHIGELICVECSPEEDE